MMARPANTKEALSRAADAVRAAATSLLQAEERLRFESEGDEDLLDYLRSIEGARQSVESLSDQLRSYVVRVGK